MIRNLVGDKFAVADLAAVGGRDEAVCGLELVRRHGKAARRLGHEDRASLGRGVHDRGAAVLHRLAARREAFVRGLAGIRGHQLERAERHVELLCRHLQEGGLDALTKFGLAGEDGDAAVGGDADPRIQVRARLETAR
jgi:hypothetical protein